jgi:hypothetical protein
MASLGPARRSGEALRGQPLLFLVTVLGCWTLARILHHLPEDAPLARSSPIASLPARLLAVGPVGHGGQVKPALAGGLAIPGRADGALTPDRPGAGMAPGTIDFDTALAHHRLWAESLALSPKPQGGSPLFDGPLLIDPAPGGPPSGGAPVTAAAVHDRHKRWSIYAWSLVRPSGGDAGLAPGAQYGGSQTGLIVRYRLGDHLRAPALYARATTALATGDDRSLALGVSARLWGALPVELAVERRFGLAQGQSDRFAAMLVAGGGSRLARSRIDVEAFAQAGVVGLSDRQGFFDLQMLATRQVAVQDGHAVSLGAGLWAGGQQEADASGARRWVHRVDMGPRAALAMPLGDSQMVVALDWRQRIEGDALPASGAALTLSTGF